MSRAALALLLAAGLCAFRAGAAFDPAAEAERLCAGTASSAQGESEETGFWLMAVGRAPVAGRTEAAARTAAELEARKELAAFLAARFSALTESVLTEDDSGAEAAFRSWSRMDVDTLLRGARIVASRVSGGEAVAVALLTQRNADMGQALSQAKAADAPGTVRATGEGATLDAAILAACRSAVEQTRGVSLVASDALGEDGGVRSRAYTDVMGMVSEYRVLGQEPTASGGVRVTLLAAVPEDGLKARYGAEAKAMGDPLFWVTSEDATLRGLVADQLLAKGLKTTVQQGNADYKVELRPTFEALEHPLDRRAGTRLTLDVVCYDKAGVQLFALQNDARTATSFVGTATRQRQSLAEKAAKQIAQPLHERLQRAIADMSYNGRSVRLIFHNATTADHFALVERITAVANGMQGASAAVFTRDDAAATATIRLNLRGNAQDFLADLRRAVPECPVAIEVSVSKLVFAF